MRNLLFCVFLLLIFYNKLQSQCTCVEGAGAFDNSQLVLCENFESYTNGSGFPRNNTKWALWPGTSSLASIQTSPGGSSGKSLYVQENGTVKPDVLLKLGNKSNGRYRLSWQMYIPKNKTASYNLQHDEAANRWAFDVSFGANGIGTVTRLQTVVAQFPYLTGAWNKIVHIIDISRDQMELWVNDEFIDAWAFRYGNGSNFNYDSGLLGAVNFYSTSNSGYYVDNICLWESGEIIGRPIIDPICIKNGKIGHSEYVETVHGLYTKAEFSTEFCRDVCDFGGLNTNNVPRGSTTNVNQITKKSLLPNQILNLECARDAFPILTRKQLRGVVYNYTPSSTKIYPNLKVFAPFNDKDAYIILYHCSTRSCVGMESKNAVFEVEKDEEYKIIVLSVKEIIFEINVQNTICDGTACRVDFGPCNFAENITFNKPLTNLKMPEGLFTPKDRLFDEIKKDYLGYERAFQFYIGKETEVNIELTSQGLDYAIVLTNNPCGTHLLASSETSNNGGTAQINTTLHKSGLYYILVDQLVFDPEHTFSLKYTVVDPQSIIKPPTESCPVLNNNPHTVTIRANPLLLDGEPLTLNDRIYLFNPNNTNNREGDGRNWNGQEILFTLKADSLVDNKYCGYSDEEPIEFKIIRNSKIYYVKPVFQLENGSEITASDRFKRSGKSLITGFKSEFNYDDFNIGNFPNVSSSAKQFFAEVNYKKGWRFERFNEFTPSWINITPISGYGATDVNFEVSANITTQERIDTLLLYNEEGFYKTIIIRQPGCTGPSVNAGPDQSFCPNQAINLTATGVGTISWRTDAGDIITGSRLNTTAASTQTFTALAILNGCIAIDEVTITVSSTLTANAGPDQNICTGGSTTLLASGGSSYRWSTGQNGAQISVTPTQTTTYTVTVTQNNCTATDQVVVTVGKASTAEVSPAQRVCVGSSVVLQAKGGGTYRWNTNQTTASISVSPVSSQIYQVTVSNEGCNAVGSIEVIVLPVPTPYIQEVEPICVGQSVLLTANGGDTYRWSNNTTTAHNQVSPIANTTYTVTVTKGECTNTADVVVQVKPKLIVDAGPDQNICIGGGTTLLASGGSSYRWSTGQNGAQISVTPTQTTTYTVTVTQNSCTATDQVIVMVGKASTAEVSPTQRVCVGSSVVLQAKGGNNYRWSTNQTTSSISVSPVSSQIYRVTVSSNGCSAEGSIEVIVLPAPTPYIDEIEPICVGQSVLLTANGGGTYRWSNNVISAQNRVSPITNTTYTVSVTKGECTSTTDVVVQVNPKPIANAGPDKTICQGSFTALNGSGGGTYRWSHGATAANTNVSPVSTQTYRLTVSLNGCENTDSTIVTVNRNPVITLAESRLVLGSSGYLKMNVSEGTPTYRYQWFRNDTAIYNQKDLYGLQTGVYRLVVVDAKGCTATFGPRSIVVTAAREVVSFQELTISPNPTQGELYIKGRFGQKERIQVKILDATGKYIWQSDIKNSHEFLYSPDLYNLAKGMYIIQFDVSGGLAYRKLIVN